MAGNKQDPSGTNMNHDIGGDFTTASGSANIVLAFDGNVAGPSPISGDPLLGPLADNGGPTQTMLPLSGSPAIEGAAFFRLETD